MHLVANIFTYSFYFCNRNIVYDYDSNINVILGSPESKTVTTIAPIDLFDGIEELIQGKIE